MKGKKIKSATSRRTKNKASIDSILNEVKKETGYQKKDIRIVYDAILMVWKRRLLKKQSVVISGLGTLIPWITPRMNKLALYGGKKDPKRIVTPPRWTFKFIMQKLVNEELKAIKVTEKEERDLYED